MVKLKLLKIAVAAASLPALAVAGADDVSQQVKHGARQVLLEQATRNGLRQPLLSLNVVSPNSKLPACRQALRVDPVDTRQARRMRFVATCPGSDGWRHEFIVRASISAEVQVAALAMPSGRPIAADDLALARHDVTNIPDAVSDAQAILGMTSRRSIRAGEPVREGWLAPSTLVRRGDAVSIVARSGEIEVTVAGEALDAGARDAVIRVRNVGNGKIIRARVLESATVEPVEIVRAIP
jgi:flagella basal body P-ring formation protein FlgA